MTRYTPARHYLTFGIVAIGLARFLPANRLLSAGFYPFLAGDLLKSAVCAALLPWGWGRLGSKGGQGLTE